LLDCNYVRNRDIGPGGVLACTIPTRGAAQSCVTLTLLSKVTAQSGDKGFYEDVGFGLVSRHINRTGGDDPALISMFATSRSSQQRRIAQYFVAKQLTSWRRDRYDARHEDGVAIRSGAGLIERVTYQNADNGFCAVAGVQGGIGSLVGPATVASRQAGAEHQLMSRPPLFEARPIAIEDVLEAQGRTRTDYDRKKQPGNTRRTVAKVGEKCGIAPTWHRKHAINPACALPARSRPHESPNSKGRDHPRALRFGWCLSQARIGDDFFETQSCEHLSLGASSSTELEVSPKTMRRPARSP